MKKQAVWPFDFTGYKRKKNRSVPLSIPVGDVMYDDDGVWLSLGDGIQIDLSPVLENGTAFDEDTKIKSLRDGANKRLKKRK